MELQIDKFEVSPIYISIDGLFIINNFFTYLISTYLKK